MFNHQLFSFYFMQNREILSLANSFKLRFKLRFKLDINGTMLLDAGDPPGLLAAEIIVRWLKLLCVITLLGGHVFWLLVEILEKKRKQKEEDEEDSVFQFLDILRLKWRTMATGVAVLLLMAAGALAGLEYPKHLDNQPWQDTFHAKVVFASLWVCYSILLPQRFSWWRYSTL